MTKVALVFLGCPKNLVDFQVTAEYLKKAGYDVGVPADQADVILVTTCSFIESARREAYDAIGQAVEIKENPELPCRAVIVAGCLPQRYREDVFRQCPGIDGIAGVDDLDRLDEVIASALENPENYVQGVTPGPSTKLFSPPDPGFVLTNGPWAYLKIGEGCRHACAFCAIPGIRGRLRSRPVDEIVAEAKALLRTGIGEIDLIAQDVTAYGADFKDGTNLAALLRRLDALPGTFRMRLLYGHPAGITDELLDGIATSKHVLPYFDIPLQHSEPDVLRAMHRADTVALVPEMAKRIRARIPQAVLRTTILVGFPGETARHQTALLDFIRETRFDHLGCFAFSIVLHFIWNYGFSLVPLPFFGDLVYILLTIAAWAAIFFIMNKGIRQIVDITNSYGGPMPAPRPAPVPAYQQSGQPAPAAAYQQGGQPAPGRAAGPPVLVGIGGVYAGKTIPCEPGQMVFGREASVCSLVFPSNVPGISRKHCILEFKNGKFFLTDCNSTYGTYLGDGRRLPPGVQAPLESGQRFYMGNELFEVRM